MKRSFVTEVDKENDMKRAASILGADPGELSFYKGNEVALPDSAQGGALVEQLKELEELKKRKERLSTAPKEERRESVRDYIKNTRSILLAKIAMHEKKQEAERMKEYIQQKESVLNLNKDIYEQDKAMVNKYVEFMNNEAFKKKKDADKKAKERQIKEAELDRLIQVRANLKKDLGDNKDICTTYKTHMDFILSLNPEAAAKRKALGKPKKMINKFFLTEQGAQKDSEAAQVVDKELQEIKDDLGLSENDSDTEISPGFVSINEFLELMNKQAADNLTLIQDSQKREESLERMRKDYEKTIDAKTKILDSIKRDINELREEERKKMTRFNELAERVEADSLSSNTDQFLSEEKIKQMKTIKSLKRIIKKDIINVRNIFLGSDKGKIREIYDDPSANKNLVAALTYITECLLKLKMLRDYKFMTEGKGSLLRRELEEKDRAKQEAAKEARNRNMETARKKREDLRYNWKIPRYRKFGKEIMKRKAIKEGPKKKEVKVEKRTDSEFDDKYFID